MPTRKERQSQQQTQQAGGPVWQPVHRFAFVQRLMRTGYMRKSSALEMFEQLTGSDSNEAFEDMVATQNAEMQQLSFQIRTLRHPQDKQLYLGFVNTLADEPSKCATHLNHGHREFFKHVLAAIAADPTAEGGVGSASSIALLNMDVTQPLSGHEATEAQKAAAAQAKKMTKTDRQKLLDQLCAEGWLQHSSSRSGYYCIGPRSFMELADLLLSLDMPEETKAAWEDFL